MADQESGAAEQEPGSGARGEGWRRPWVPWAVSLGLLMLGGAVGWTSSYLALRPMLGEPAMNARPASPAAPAGDGAVVAVIGAAGPAAPGEQVTVTWQAVNTGGTAWAVDRYRFVPADQRTPVIPLPHAVSPGTGVTVQAVLTVPDVKGTWQPAWTLTGPKGAVPGGGLAATVEVRPAEAGGS